jgi:hypothetical protein
MEYSREKFIIYVKKMLKSADKHKHSIYAIRPLYLYLIRRQRYMLKNPNIYKYDRFEKISYEKSIEHITDIKKRIKKYKNVDEKLCKYYKLALNNMKTFVYLFTYKDTITTLCIQKKLNGNNDVCRHILSYI